MKKGDITITQGSVHITLSQGTVWLSVWQMAELFEVFDSKITSNIRSILKNNICREADVKRTHYFDGGSVDLYNLEMITALAFRIESHNARIFRRWIVERTVEPKRVLEQRIVFPFTQNALLN